MNYRIDVTGTESLYFDCFDKTTTALKEDINDSFDVTVNGVKVEVNYPTQKNNGLLYLGTFTDERVQVTVSVHKNVTARSFGLFGVKDKKWKHDFRHCHRRNRGRISIPAHHLG